MGYKYHEENRGITLLITPTEDDIQKINSDLLKPKILRQLVIDEDRIRLQDHIQGYLITKQDAFLVNQRYCDLAVNHLEIEREIEGYYNIPILSSQKQRDIMPQAYKECMEKRSTRVMVKTLEQEKPYLIDIDMLGIPHITFSKYLGTNQIAESMGFEQNIEFRKKIKEIADELSGKL